LPGVIGVDSVLAARDTQDLARLLALPRRMTAAQTGSIGTMVDLATAFKVYTRDSTAVRRLGAMLAPIDISYTRSLLTAIDASPVNAPMPLQLGLVGPAAFRRVGGVDATTAGQTGTFATSGSLLLPFGTSFTNRYRRTTTLNFIQRPDSTLAHVDGAQTQFPDVSLNWTFHPATPVMNLSTLEAGVGYVRNSANVSLPNLFNDDPPEIRRTHAELYPVSGTIAWAGRTGLSAHAQYTYRQQIDSLPGSVARSHGTELSADAGRAFHIPEGLGLGFKSDLRTRIGVQQSSNSTLVFDPTGTMSSRLQDNGRQSINLTADTNLMDNATFTFQGAYVVSFDNTLNHRFAQTIISVVLQLQVFGTSK
jgi:hypothetical protein